MTLPPHSSPSMLPSGWRPSMRRAAWRLPEPPGVVARRKERKLRQRPTKKSPAGGDAELSDGGTAIAQGIADSSRATGVSSHPRQRLRVALRAPSPIPTSGALVADYSLVPVVAVVAGPDMADAVFVATLAQLRCDQCFTALGTRNDRSG
jgi:hypothetical protein